MITSHEHRCGGQPCVGASRLTVRAVVAFFRLGGVPSALRAYPYLTEADVLEAVAYVDEHPEVMAYGNDPPDVDDP